MKTPYITLEGRKALDQKVFQMVEEIKAIQEEKNVAYHISGDGWHDNPGFNQLEQKEHRAVEEMVKLKQHIARAQVYIPKKEKADTIQIGSMVSYIQKSVNSARGMKMQWQIVGSGESDVRLKKIGYDTPIGQQLMDKKAGDQFEIQLPAGRFAIDILEVSLS